MHPSVNSLLTTLRSAAAPGRLLIIGEAGDLLFGARREGYDVSIVRSIEAFLQSAQCNQLARYDIVVCATDLANTPEDQRDILCELLSRACTKTLIVQATLENGPLSRARGSALDWQKRFLCHDLRRHVTNWSSRGDSGDGVTPLCFECLPEDLASAYPLEKLARTRDLHMDMLREPGSRADAHLVRYQVATRYIAPGDAVLDAACGLGYGCALIGAGTRAGRVLGLDESHFAIDYAHQAYSGPGIEFQTARLPDALKRMEPSSFDVVVSFETLEHLEDPGLLIAEFHRILRPAGRLIVSVPNDWSDESGTDPNPYHLQVYTWPRLQAELSAMTHLGARYAQIGSRVKIQGKFRQKAPSLLRVPLDAPDSIEAEWWIGVAHRDPFDGQDLTFSDNLIMALHDATFLSANRAAGFENPWLIPALSRPKSRPRDPQALLALVRKASERALPGSVDLAAAICTEGYMYLSSEAPDHPNPAILTTIDHWLNASDAHTPERLRWSVSLMYLKAQLHEMQGDRDAANAAFLECLSADFLRFDATLATKVTRSGNRAAAYAIADGDLDRARKIWRKVVTAATDALHNGTPRNQPDTTAPPYLFPELSEIAEQAALAVHCLTYVRQVSEYPGVMTQHSAPLPKPAPPKQRASDTFASNGPDLRDAKLINANDWCQFDDFPHTRSCLLHPSPADADTNPVLLLRNLQPAKRRCLVIKVASVNPSSFNSGARLLATCISDEAQVNCSQLLIAPHSTEIMVINLDSDHENLDLTIDILRHNSEASHRASAIQLSAFRYF